ncbi:MAG: SHOCT domain-containing protein [Bacteroidetes bacterium]|nr:SHOCT domain-containing protein [Bacteroidota bacterium]
MYNGNYYWGMDIIWWFVWIGLLFWIFALPYNIPGQRRRMESPFDILQKRFASGEISSEEYQASKKILEEEFAR